MASENKEESYDVFICYRRDTSSETARLIKLALQIYGLRVFIDVDELPSGHFDKNLLKIISETPNFIIILSKDCLAERNENVDWFRREIQHAINTKRNIIPVIMKGFEFSLAVEAKDELKDLPRYQGVNYHHDYFDAMIAKILKYIRRESRKHPKEKTSPLSEISNETKLAHKTGEELKPPSISPEKEVSTPLFDQKILKGLLSDNKSLVLSSFHRIDTKQRNKYIEAVVAHLSNPSDEIKIAAMSCLLYIRYKYLPELLVMLARSSSKSVRRRAVIYLGNLHYKGALDIISGLCSDPSQDVRAAAREAFKKITGRNP